MEENRKNCDKATFTINIEFQQNHTWQGSISWLEGECTQRFRSELEMIKLMMDALSRNEDGTETEENLPSW